MADEATYEKPEPMKSEVVRDSASWNANLARFENQRCTAHRKNGQQCRKFAIFGTNVCRVHGEAAKQVKAKAQRRIAMAADSMAREVIGIVKDKNISEAVRVTAIRDALDRAGVSAKTAIDVEVAVKPWEEIYTKITSGTREDYRRGTQHDDEDETQRPAIESGIESGTEAQTETNQDTQDSEDGVTEADGTDLAEYLDVEILSDEPDGTELLGRMTGPAQHVEATWGIATDRPGLITPDGLF